VQAMRRESLSSVCLLERSEYDSRSDRLSFEFEEEAHAARNRRPAACHRKASQLPFRHGHTPPQEHAYKEHVAPR